MQKPQYLLHQPNKTIIIDTNNILQEKNRV